MSENTERMKPRTCYLTELLWSNEHALQFRRPRSHSTITMRDALLKARTLCLKMQARKEKLYNPHILVVIIPGVEA